MTRVSGSINTTDRKQLKKELKKEIGRPKVIKKGGCLSLGNCCLGLVVFAGLLVVLGAILIAKTGLVDIPIATKLFYKAPEPDHWVTVTDEEVAGIEKTIATKIGEQFLAKAKGEATGSLKEVSLGLNETELTALLLHGLKGADEKKTSTVRDAQIAIVDDKIEFFGYLQKPVVTHITLQIRPSLSRGELKPRVVKVRLGRMPLPAVIVNFGLRQTIKEPLNELEVLTKDLELTAVEVKDGQLIITGEIK